MKDLPPRWADRLLRASVPPEDMRAVVGELHELYAHRRLTRGVFSTRAWYWKQAFTFSALFLRERVAGWAGRGALAAAGGRRMSPGVEPTKGLTQELRFAARSLRRSPGFSTVTALTLALGIGANAAIFSLVNGILVRPLVFPDSEKLVTLSHEAPGWGVSFPQSSGTYFLYRSEARAFEGVALWDLRGVSVTGGQAPERLLALDVDEAFFPLLRVRPLLGRLFQPDDNRHEAPRSVVLSNGYWQRRFGGDPGVIGRTLLVDGSPRDIIGVLPSRFHFWSRETDPELYLPVQLDSARARAGGFQYGALARLKPTMTPEDATDDLARLVPRLPERYPGEISLAQLLEARFAPDVRSLKEEVVGDVGDVLWVIVGAVSMVLLMVCASVANLLFARAEGRQREVAVRTAMGASRGRIARHFLAEGVLLGLIGGVGGLALALVGLKALVALDPIDLPRLTEISVDPAVLVYTLGISLGAGLLLGLLCLLRYGRPDVASSLRAGGQRATGGGNQHRARNALVVAQVAMAVALLVGSGLMVRSFIALRAVAPGFDEPGEILTVRLTLPPADYPDDERVASTHEQVVYAIERIPGVVSAGVSTSVALDEQYTWDPVWVDGFPLDADQLPAAHRLRWVGGGYFDAMGHRVLAGRVLDWSDVHARTRTAVVTRAFSSQFWDDPSDAVGKRIRQLQREEWSEIVGVVGDVYDDGVGQDPVSLVYWPMVGVDPDGSVQAARSMVHTIRVHGVPATGVVAAVRAAIWSIDPNLPLTDVRTMAELLSGSMARTSFITVVLGTAALLALILGTIGVYGVISYLVSQKTRELGVRMALGADPARTTRRVLGKGIALAATGIGIGLVVAVGLTRVMSAFLFGVGATDPLTLASVAVGLGGIALLATYVPARRAARLDPVSALRCD